MGDVNNLNNAALKIGEETRSLVQFIVSIKFIPVSAQHGGCTWIELYLLFRLSVETKSESGLSLGSARPTVATIVVQFKKILWMQCN